MVDWIVFPIPRAFWEGKPVNVGSQLAAIIYDANNGTPPGLIGDIYWNFWIFGVLAGMFIIGLVLRSLVSYRGRSSNSPAAILFTTVSIYLIARLPAVTPLMISLGLWLVPISIAILVVRIPPKKSSQEVVEELPVPLKSSLLARTILISILLPHRLISLLRKDAGKSITTISNSATSKVIDSSYFLNIIKRFDQSPDEQN
jgi:hypothetical protein